MDKSAAEVTLEDTQRGQDDSSRQSNLLSFGIHTPTNDQSTSTAADQHKPPLPVTVISGFLGSGKTTLLKHILENTQNMKCAVIVNDMASLNIDSQLISEHSKLIRTEVKMVELSNGCICCNLREDLLVEITRLCAQGNFDYLVIESTGISEPLKVAETFTFQFQVPTGDQFSLSELATLDTCVTVVDADSFFDAFEGCEILSERFAEENPPSLDDRTVTELMIDQIEFADIIILNKVDLVSKEHLRRVTQTLSQFNKSAKIIESSFCKIDLARIMNTKLFDFDRAQQNRNWLASDRFAPSSETVEYDISSFVYKSRVPFHDEKIFQLMKTNFFYVKNTHDHASHAITEGEKEELAPVEQQQPQPEMDEAAIENAKKEFRQMRQESLEAKKAGSFALLLRSKGFFFVASNGNYAWEWSQQGIMLNAQLKGLFGASLDAELLAQVPESMKKDWDPVTGDRETSLVFIGQHLNEEKIRAQLDNCLLSTEELAQFVRDGFSLEHMPDHFGMAGSAAVGEAPSETA